MIEAASVVLIGAGAALILLAAIGLLRMPDVYLRLSATSKSSSLGVTLVLLGVAMLLGEQSVTLRVIAIIAFVFLTAPIASHVIGRGAYKSGVKLWAGSVVDEMKDDRTSALCEGERVHWPGSFTTIMISNRN